MSNNSPYSQGYRACLRGLTPESCSYEFGSREWDEWMMGYQDAENSHEGE